MSSLPATEGIKGILSTADNPISSAFGTRQCSWDIYTKVKKVVRFVLENNKVIIISPVAKRSKDDIDFGDAFKDLRRERRKKKMAVPRTPADRLNEVLRTLNSHRGTPKRLKNSVAIQYRDEVKRLLTDPSFWPPSESEDVEEERRRRQLVLFMSATHITSVRENLSLARQCCLLWLGRQLDLTSSENSGNETTFVFDAMDVGI